MQLTAYRLSPITYHLSRNVRTRYRLITRAAKVHPERSRRRAEDVPNSARVDSHDSGIGLAVAIVIACRRNITGKSPLNSVVVRRRVRRPVPEAGRWTIDRHAVAAVSVVIRRHRNVALHPERVPDGVAVRAVEYPPRPLHAGRCRRPVHREIGLPVTVVVAECRNIARGPERSIGIRSVRIQHPPRPGLRTIDRDLGIAIPVEVSGLG